MIALGVRLAVAGGREAIARLGLIAIAVAIGVALLLTTLSAMNAFDAQNQRYAWLETGYAGAAPPAGTAPAAGSEAADPLWWSLRADHFGGERIGRVEVAATGPDAPLPPGIPALPAPGELYASPALAALLQETPAGQLHDRYPGTLIGTVGTEALPAPDSLITVIGRAAADLAGQDGARLVTQISTTPPSECSGECAPGVGTGGDGMVLVLSVVAAALLFPVLIFIGVATRLSAARREQRFAAMRLVGATPRQVAQLATVEASLATVAGVAVGFGLFLALRPKLATIPFAGDRFFVDDLSLRLPNVMLVALGVPVAAALAARLSLRRVSVSPLGVVRRVTPLSPRVWRLAPLLVGIGWLAHLAYRSDIAESQSSTSQALAYLAGVITVMVGLLIAGPWLTMVGSRFLARRASRPAGLIAARRLDDDPRSAFRAVSGLVLAVFVGSCAIGIITTIVAYNDGAAGSAADTTGTLIHTFFRGRPSDQTIEALPAGAQDELRSIPGVSGVAAVRVELTADAGSPSEFDARFLVSCEQIASTPALGHCPDEADTVTILPHFGGPVIDTSAPMADTTWPAAAVTTGELSSLPIDTVVVATDGSTAAVETARTVLELTLPTEFSPVTLSELEADNTRTISSYRQLAGVVLFSSLPIAGCSLAVSIAGGLAERRRPFSLLRLTGVSLAVLRRVVTLEAAAPLLISAAVSAGAGLLAAALFLRAQLDQTLQPPTPTYYLLLGTGVVASLAVVASVLPLLERLTGPETARND